VLKTLLALVGLLLLALLWIAAHALADDARPAVGQARSVARTPAITYYVQVPQGPQVGAGKAEAVVMVASLGRSVSDFNELATALNRQGYRTLAVESRGIVSWSGGGFSAYRLSDLAGDVRAVLADAGIGPDERVHLIGHAYGNRVARTFATLYPAQTAGLVLVAAGDKTDNMPPEVARPLRLSTLGFIPWSVRGGAVGRIFFASGNPVPDYWARGWGAWGAIGQVRAATAPGNQDFLAGGSGPMLVLQAADDLITPPRDAGERLKAAYGDRVTLVSVPKAGHALLPEAPDLIAREVIGFLQSHPAR
jgi:pimeloyl-ACP methyl ester carboxylesterase